MSNNPEQQCSSRVQFAERGALICAIGAVVGFGVSILQPLLDWRREALMPFSQYLVLGLLLCGPFIIGFLMSAWFIRRKRS